MSGRPARGQAQRTEDIDDPLTVERIMDLAREISGVIGLDSRGAHLIKFTINAVIALPSAGAVLRIAGSAPTRARIPGLIATARWLAEHKVPAVRLWPDVQQPIRIGTHEATLWELASKGGPNPRPSDLARILKIIHSVSDSPAIPLWAPLDGVRRRLLQATGIEHSTLDLLEREMSAVECEMESLNDRLELPPGPIHGDAHLGNLIATPKGPIICDFDSSSIGPREWDLTPAAVGALRFDYGPKVHNELAAAYGIDVTRCAAFPILRRLRELQLVTSVIPILSANPRLRPQWEFRVSTLLDLDPERPWTPFANV